MVREMLRLIGGTRDGERVEYRGERIRMPARHPLQPSPEFLRLPMPTTAVANYDEYRLATRAYKPPGWPLVERIDAYVHDSISDDDAAKRLDEIMGWAP